ncbi:MAG: PDZ domain-containing protein [Gammaproteobacteria bacterium]
MSFAIPIQLAMSVVQQLREHGHVIRGWLGVSIVDVAPDEADSLHLSRPEGALARKVLAASPAACASLKTDDVFLSYNGMNVVSSETLPPLVGSTAVGQAVPLIVLRGGLRQALSVKIGILPAREAETRESAAVDSRDVEFDSLGLAVRSLTESERRQSKLKDRGVVVDQVANGPARRAGFEPGDVVLMVNGTLINSPCQFGQLEKQLPAKQPVPILVQRSDETLFLPLQAGRG